jgi:hypothetical protein
LVDGSEQVAEGLISEEELYRICLEAYPTRENPADPTEESPLTCAHQALGFAINQVECFEAYTAAGWAVNAVGEPEEEVRVQIALLRDIFGNPLRAPSPRSFPDHVIGLAQECYSAFPAVTDRFLILADALADVGEEVAASHCRESIHVKGCHMLDWILRKK